MGLTEYNKKRNFKDTPEPSATKSKENKFRFVIQRHQASRLHYDLRLEIGGVLKSWAVPKGPSMHTGDKRLAVQTEDHPVSYLTFEGAIPKGNYGAGEMHIWDNGTFNLTDAGTASTEKAVATGKLNLEFHGKKLKGLFTLVRSSSSEKQNHWLLIKKKDIYATALHYDAEDYISHTEKPSPPPKVRTLQLKKPIRPMLASPGKVIFNDPKWLYELKYDGYRAIATIQNGTVELYSRNGISFNEKFAFIYNQLTKMEHDVVLDGEIVVVNNKGVPQFQALQNYQPGMTKGTLQYFVFDILHLNGHDMHTLTLTERKSFLPELLEPLSHVLYAEHLEGMGKTLYAKAVKMGMEGVIAKKCSSVYTPGYRSEDWVKLKKTESMEAIICGYTISEKATRPFGSLILGMMDTGTLAYVGN
nr:ATP-dependent DNA ligase [Flavobacteriales bacterium]